VNFVGISMALNNVNWNEIFSNTNIATIVKEFYNIVNTILENYVPTKSKYEFPSCFDSNL